MADPLIETSLPSAVPTVPDQRPDPHVMDYLLVVSRHRWPVSILFFLTAGLFLAATYVIPQSYQAVALVLPPDRVSSAGMLSNLVEGSALSILKQVENPSVDLLQNFLESRTMAERLASDREIRAFYSRAGATEEDLIKTVRESLRSRPEISKLVVTGTVWTGWNASAAEKQKARQISARIVNLSMATTDSLFKSEFRISSHFARIHVEADYVVRRAELDSLDMAQENFERVHGIIAIKEQTKQAVAQLGKLEAERDEARLKFGFIGQDLAEEDPRYRAAKAQAEETDRSAREYAIREGIGPSLALLPEISREYLSILRRKTSLEPIVTYLRVVMEQERVNEEREKSLIMVLDSATVPDHRSSPKRFPMLMLGIFVGVAVGILYLGFSSFLVSWKEESRRRAVRQGVRNADGLLLGKEDRSSTDDGLIQSSS